MIADKGYDSAEIVPRVESLGAVVVIPPRRHWKQPCSYDRELYKERNCIERCFNRLKRFSRFSTRTAEPSNPFAPAQPSPAVGSHLSYVDTA